VETLMANETARVVIIGGGHNGLVTAFYLAKAGFAPVVLERREMVGGIAVTEDIHPGFRCPTVMHGSGPLLPQVVQDLQLKQDELQPIKTSAGDGLVTLHPDGHALRIWDDPLRTAAGPLFPVKDAAKYPEFHACLGRLGAAIRPLLGVTPPEIDNMKTDDYLNLGRFGLKFRGLAQKDAYRLLRWGPMPVADLAAEWFESELLRAVVEARGVYGSSAGPWSAGTSVGVLMQAAFGGRTTALRGGTGTLTQVLAKAASAAGARIRTNATVKRISVRNGAVSAVVLETGEEIGASAVVSNADPRRTFLEMVEATELDPGFLTKVRAYRTTGSVAKVNLALSGLPNFSAVKKAEELPVRIQIGPDTDYIERAFDAAKYGEFSAQPYMDICIPSIADSAMAPAGAHVMSIHVQYVPYKLKTGDWNTRREELGDTVVNALAEYAPNIRSLIVHRQVLTPLDLEEVYGLTGGHIFHGEHALDQLFAFRPFLGWAQYRTPIKGLYLCGSGTHPGGGITGAPGFNAGREILKDLKSRR